MKVEESWMFKVRKMSWLLRKWEEEIAANLDEHGAPARIRSILDPEIVEYVVRTVSLKYFRIFSRDTLCTARVQMRA